MESLSIYNAKVLLKNFVFPAQFFIILYWTLWTLSISKSVLLFSTFIFGPEYGHGPAWIEMESILYNLTPRRKYHFPQQNFFLPVKNHNNYHYYVNKSSFMDFGEGFLYLCGFFFYVVLEYSIFTLTITKHWYQANKIVHIFFI